MFSGYMTVNQNRPRQDTNSKAPIVNAVWLLARNTAFALRWWVKEGPGRALPLPPCCPPNTSRPSSKHVCPLLYPTLQPPSSIHRTLHVYFSCRHHRPAACLCNHSTAYLHLVHACLPTNPTPHRRPESPRRFASSHGYLPNNIIYQNVNRYVETPPLEYDIVDKRFKD